MKTHKALITHDEKLWLNGHSRNLNWRYLPYIRPTEGLCKGIFPQNFHWFTGKTKNLMVDRHCVKVAILYSGIPGIISEFRNYVGGLPTLRVLGLYINGGFLSHGGTPKSSFISFFSIINHLAIGFPPLLWKSPYNTLQSGTCPIWKNNSFDDLLMKKMLIF